MHQLCLALLFSAIAAGAAVPYYVHQKFFTHLPNGTQRLDSQQTFARRSDGSVFEKVETYDHDGALVNTGSHLALTGGLLIDTDDLAGVMTSMQLPDGDNRRDAMQWTPESKCTRSAGGKTVEATEEITEEQINGHPAFKIVTDVSGARVVFWRAKDLGCAVLKETLEMKDPSGKAVAGWAEVIADDIRPGEPPAALFVPPTKLKNVPPTERIKGNHLNKSGLVPASARQDDELFRKYKTP